MSLVIITLNEEANISRCVESVPFASEVIVVDSFSSDQTVARAESLGAKVIKQAFLGYRAQKQFAMEQASYDWVLSLDADEVLSSELQHEIKNLLAASESSDDNAVNGYRMPRLSFHLGRWIRHGGWYPDYQTRLVRKSRCQWDGGAVHERIEIPKEQLGTLRHPIHHYVFKNLEDQIETNNEFSSLGAEDLHKRGQLFSLQRLLLKPLGKFLECYIWKRGFLDGAAGFIIALGAAQSVFFKYAKLWEIESFGTAHGASASTKLKLPN